MLAPLWDATLVYLFLIIHFHLKEVCWHYNKQRCNHFNVQMVPLCLEMMNQPSTSHGLESQSTCLKNSGKLQMP